MTTTNHTVLITGGATGIGLSLAETFVKAGNTVIICGRRAEALAQAKTTLPGLITFQADVSLADDRQRLVDWLLATYPKVNVLVNNAGIQRRIDLRQGAAQLGTDLVEMNTNFEAVVQLNALLLPHLLRQPQAAVVHVGSGLGLVPLAAMPIYCASKAALHAYSRCLRLQVKGSNLKVFDLWPPVVNTELDQGMRARSGQKVRAIEPQAVADEFWRAWQRNQEVIPVAMVKVLRLMNRLFPAFIFKKMNERVPLPR